MTPGALEDQLRLVARFRAAALDCFCTHAVVRSLESADQDDAQHSDTFWVRHLGA